jgi:hypothetical protein
LNVGWDDDCLGLAATLAREEEWRCREDHNDNEAASWAVEAPNGWGGTRPVSPIVEKVWPGTRPEDQCFPRLEDLPPGPDGWLDLSIPTLGGVWVTMTTTVEEVEGHSTCRLPMLIVHLSVPDLLSFLYHSTVGTSFRSCAPCHPSG